MGKCMDGYLEVPGSVPAYMKYFVIIFLNFFQIIPLIQYNFAQWWNWAVVGRLGSVGVKTSFSFTISIPWWMEVFLSLAACVCLCVYCTQKVTFFLLNTAVSEYRRSVIVNIRQACHSEGCRLLRRIILAVLGWVDGICCVSTGCHETPHGCNETPHRPHRSHRPKI